MRHARYGVVMWGLAGGVAWAGGETVYQNLSTPTGMYSVLVPAGAAASGLERGNTVSLGGVQRGALVFEVLSRVAGVGIADLWLRVRVYANDGVGGAPGAMLWDSGPRLWVIDSGADVLLRVSSPGVVLTETITWTIEITDRTGPNMSAISLPHYGPPTVGAAAPGYWERTAGGGWQQGGAGGQPFGARIVAGCYANCDSSTTMPVLTVQDFNCFLSLVASGNPHANCDGSTTLPIITVLDFICYLNRYAIGCS